MEHRETPRMAMSEDPTRDATEPVGARRFARFVPAPSVRRIAFSRIGLVVLASVGLGLLFILASTQLLQSLATWLHRQPAYQLDPQQVVFDPPVPPWIKGGPAGFLGRLRMGMGPDELKSVLDIDLQRVRKDLRHDSWDYWVKKVVRLRRKYPNRLTVQLEFRKPVASVGVGGKRDIMIDESGVILPRDDVDFDALGPLVQIQGVGRPPADESPGKFWKKAGESHGDTEADEQVLAAAELAGFLEATKAGQSDRLKSARPPAIHVDRDKGLLWLIVHERTGRWPVLWGEASRADANAAGSAEARLGWLDAYTKQHDPSELGERGYLKFSKTGVMPNKSL